MNMCSNALWVNYLTEALIKVIAWQNKSLLMAQAVFYKRLNLLNSLWVSGAPVCADLIIIKHILIQSCNITFLKMDDRQRGGQPDKKKC